MKRGIIACALLASGCFRYAPVTSLGSIDDDRVVIDDGESKRTLVHATANGRMVEGQSAEDGEHVVVDATRARSIFARKLNAPATGAIIGASALGLVGTVAAIVLVVIANESHPIPFEGQR
jgi:hypothetical protein